MLKDITFSVEEELINKALERASAENSSLNIVFRRWLKQYTERERIADEFDQVMESLKGVYSGGKISRNS